jgi:hypothetical protein
VFLRILLSFGGEEMNKIFQGSKIWLILFVLIGAGIATAQTSGDQQAAQEKIGSITGQILDNDTREPIVGASILIMGTQKGAASDTSGRFSITKISAGSYSLQYKAIGYETQIKTDIMVRPSRITATNIELTPHPIEAKDITVTGEVFSGRDVGTGLISFSGEEVRRSPGSAGDVSRIISVLPSIGKVDDQLNSLVVRGGNPSENAFYLDNIEIPNINHYPLQGSSGGPIGLLYTDFIDDVSFSAGGFPATFGNRLSSIMEIKFREGNRKEFDSQIDMSMAGLGGVIEGPVASGRGSYLLAVRRSYLDWFVDAIGTGVAPKYSDYQGKLTYDLSPSNKISLVGLAGVDYIKFRKKDSEDNGNIVYGKSDGYEYAGGVDWLYLWSKNGYSNTSVSMQGTKYKEIFNETKSEKLLVDENSLEQAVTLRNISHYRFSDSHRVEFGFDLKYHLDNYDQYLSDYTNALGDSTPPLIVNLDIKKPQMGAFASYIWQVTNKLTATGGLRYDYLKFNDQGHLSPRLAFAYSVTPQTTLKISTGIYYQNLPLSFLAQGDSKKNLKDPVAYHYIAGVDHLLGNATRLTVEGYYKDYRNFPMDPKEPQFFIADELVYQRMYGDIENVIDKGKARSYGLELTLQKKLMSGIYGLVGGSLFKSEYQDLGGIWRNRISDNRGVFSVEGGYKPSNKWEYSLRWVFAGGPAYTPLDLERSQELNRSVLDSSRVNDARTPAYHSLSLRVDRRFYWKSSNMILYFSIWNAYNRKNVSYYYWNEIERRQDDVNQWSLLPVMGMEFEF